MIINKDIIIIGAGPAGMSAGLYLARSKYSFIIIEKEMSGGKLNITTEIENYPGVGKIDGFSLGMKIKKQLEEFNVEFHSDNIVDIKKDEERNVFFSTGEKDQYVSKIVVIATGSTFKKLGIKNEKEFLGNGISYCAVCDGFFFKKKDVAVFASSKKGYLEALYLANIVNKLYLISDTNEDDEENDLENLKSLKNVIFLPYFRIVSFNGEDRLTSLTIKNIKTKEEETVNVEGCFPFLGDVPSSYIAQRLNIEMENSYIITNQFMETSMKGLYAVGDIIKKPLRQVVTACSDGAIAATGIIRELNSRNNK